MLRYIYIKKALFLKPEGNQFFENIKKSFDVLWILIDKIFNGTDIKIIVIKIKGNYYNDNKDVSKIFI